MMIAQQGGSTAVAAVVVAKWPCNLDNAPSAIFSPY